MKNFIKHITIIFFSCFVAITQSQTSLTPDSLQNYINRAERLQKQYKYDESLRIAKIALQNANYNDDNKSRGLIYNIIAENYNSNKELEKALSYYKKALIHSQISKNTRLETDVYYNIGLILTQNKKTEDEGIDYFKKSYKYAKQLKDTTRLINPLLSLGKYYTLQKDSQKAYEYISFINKLVTPNSSNLIKTKLNGLLGKYYLSINKYDHANLHSEKAIHFATKETENQTNSNELKSTFYEEIAAAYKIKSDLFYVKKDYKKAHYYLENHLTNLLEALKIKKLAESQRAYIKFEVDQYEEQIKQAKFDKAERDTEAIKWRISIILGVILILISLAFLISSYKNNLQKKKLNQDLIEKNKELISAKETAEQVSTLKSQFISTVSHELRTPLYGVIGLTSLLIDDTESSKRQEYLESLKFSGDYLLALINDVLQLSKIETNDVKLEKVTFDLKPLVEGIVNSLKAKQKDSNNTINIEIDKKINTTLLGDSVRLSQILINLIGNALKFTENGNIWIKIKCLDNNSDTFNLRFTVKDNGIGIPKNKQKSIFENFVQVKNQSQEYEGTGLGLAIVRKLIHLHNSEIYINSKEGVGSEFYFDLVYEKINNEQLKSFNPGENKSIGTSNFNILIVDDNKINQIVTKNILKKKGYTCEIANNGMDAIDMLKNMKFDLVLMDINMPEMNGLDATRIMRTFNKTIPIIALTAVDEKEVRDNALSAGMNDVIIKPYDTQHFFQIIMRNISKIRSM